MAGGHEIAGSSPVAPTNQDIILTYLLTIKAFSGIKTGVNSDLNIDTVWTGPLENFKVEAYKQGLHSTPVPEKIGDFVREYIIKTLNIMRSELAHDITYIHIIDTVIEQVKTAREPWKLDVHGVHIRGHSHHYRATIRAYQVTTHNTLDLIVQPGDASTRRRCMLSVPSDVQGRMVGKLLDGIFSGLRPHTTYQMAGTIIEAISIDVAFENRIHLGRGVSDETKAGRSAAKAASNFLRSRDKKASFVQLFLSHYGGEGAISTSEVNGLLTKQWNQDTPAQTSKFFKEVRENLFSKAVLGYGLLAPDEEGAYMLGEYGNIIADELEAARRELEDRQKQRLLEEKKLDLSNLRARKLEVAERLAALDRQIAELEIAIRSLS